MGNISSNTLFHFTNSAETIIKIIKNGFAPRFCLEDFGAELFVSDLEMEETAVPMTCFCDLPLSLIGNHLEFYGCYGIGLSKNWASEKGLTPVTYFHKNSTQLKYLKQLGTLIMGLLKNNNNLQELPMDKNPYFALEELSSFFKPYEGQMWRIGKYEQKRFYDEKEWRYVPFLNINKIEYRLNKDEFLNEISKASANELIAKDFGLKFKFSDVKYIIVKKELEMVALSDSLDKMTDLFSDKEIKILKTKIISTEQIKDDF
jgi:abortive phage resistance protein AbiGi (putative antitoxin)